MPKPDKTEPDPLAILIALTEAADELDGIIHFYRPEGWEAGDLSSARELLPRLRAVLAQGWTQPDPSADAQRIGQIRELLSGGHGFIALRRDQIEWLLQRVEQAAQELLKWKTCSLCGEVMTAPGHCDSAESERVKGLEQMHEETLERAERAESACAEQAASLKHWQHCHGVTADKLVEAESALAAARQEVTHAAAIAKIRIDLLKADLAAARLRGREERETEVKGIDAFVEELHSTPYTPVGIKTVLLAFSAHVKRQFQSERKALIAARDALANERDYLRDVVAEQAHAITEKIAARDEAVGNAAAAQLDVTFYRDASAAQRERAAIAEAEIARLSSQLEEAQKEKDDTQQMLDDVRAERNIAKEEAKALRRDYLRETKDLAIRADVAESSLVSLSSQLAGMREALTEVRSVVALNAAASHMLAGFTIGPNGLPAARPRQITHEDALLAKVDAALHAAQGSPIEVASTAFQKAQERARRAMRVWEPNEDAYNAAVSVYEAAFGQGSPTKPDWMSEAEWRRTFDHKPHAFHADTNGECFDCGQVQFHAYHEPREGSPTKDEGPHG